jgi:hypothetical protein
MVDEHYEDLLNTADEITSSVEDPVLAGMMKR